MRGNASLPFKLRDHALFMGFAPHDNPRYAIGTIIEHGGHVSYIEDAPMISGDVMTYLYDPAKAMERLTKFEEQWGGDPRTRQKAQMQAYRISKGLEVPPAEAINASGVDTGTNGADAVNASEPAPAGAATNTQEATD